MNADMQRWDLCEAVFGDHDTVRPIEPTNLVFDEATMKLKYAERLCVCRRCGYTTLEHSPS